MPKVIKILTNRDIKQLSTVPGRHAVGGVKGLTLDVRKYDDAFSCSWILRRQGKNSFTVTIGSYPALSVDEARQKATELLVQHGDSNLAQVKREERRKQREIQAAIKRHDPTIEELISKWLDWKELRGEWKDSLQARYKAQQRIQRHILPNGGKLLVSQTTAEDIAELFKPIWLELPATADILLNLMKNFFVWATTVEKARSSNLVNPAEWQYLKPLLPSKKLRRKEEHYPFLEKDQLPAFFAALHKREGVSPRCTEFAILTCVRSSNARLARWEQIDFDKRLWIIDEEEMKVSANGQHIVPLSDQAMRILEKQHELRNVDDAGFVFPSSRRFRAPLGNTALNTVIKDLHNIEVLAGREGWIDRRQSEKKGKPMIAVQHAISRATFESWAHSIHAPERPIQLILHHDIDPRLGSAYDREESIEDKRKLLQKWADFCFSEIYE